jgi:hypothetical protein
VGHADALGQERSELLADARAPLVLEEGGHGGVRRWHAHVRKRKELDERCIASERVAEVLYVGLKQLQRGGTPRLALHCGKVQEAEKSDPQKSYIADAGVCGQVVLPQPVEIRGVARVKCGHELFAHVAVLIGVTGLRTWREEWVRGALAHKRCALRQLKMDFHSHSEGRLSTPRLLDESHGSARAAPPDAT